MLPNLRPDCASRIFAPRCPPARKLQKFQSLKIFVHCNIFCCIATKMCYIKSWKPRPWTCSALSRGSARWIEASHSKHEFKDIDHGRSQHSPQSEDEQARDGRVRNAEIRNAQVRHPEGRDAGCLPRIRRAR